MPSWKKVIVSGSNAELNNLSVAKASGSFSGSYQGDGSNLTAVSAISSSTAVLAQTASIATRANALAPTVTATSASTAVNAQTASVALRANALAPTVTATSASVAARATTLSSAATASFADISTLSRAGSGSFSGSFQGDGSDLTGIATSLTIDADSGGTSTVNLQTQTFDIAGTSNEIETTVSGQTVTIGLPNDVTIGQDVTITRDAIINRNLTVQGTASFQNTTDLDIADRFIRLASGSNAVGEGGFVVQQGSNGRGVVFAYDVNSLRFGSTSSFDATQNLIEPDVFFVNVVEGGSGDNDPTDTAGRYTKGGNMFIADNGEIYIYS